MTGLATAVTVAVHAAPSRKVYGDPYTIKN
jgi:hypothetical protein